MLASLESCDRRAQRRGDPCVTRVRRERIVQALQLLVHVFHTERARMHQQWRGVHFSRREQSWRPLTDIIAAAVATDIDEHGSDLLRTKCREAARQLLQPRGIYRIQRRPRCNTERWILGRPESRNAHQPEATLTHDYRAAAKRPRDSVRLHAETLQRFEGHGEGNASRR